VALTVMTNALLGILPLGDGDDRRRWSPAPMHRRPMGF
jgi:hypothetical protein